MMVIHKKEFQDSHVRKLAMPDEEEDDDSDDENKKASIRLSDRVVACVLCPVCGVALECDPTSSDDLAVLSSHALDKHPKPNKWERKIFLNDNRSQTFTKFQMRPLR